MLLTIQKNIIHVDEGMKVCCCWNPYLKLVYLNVRARAKLLVVTPVCSCFRILIDERVMIGCFLCTESQTNNA